MADITPSDLVDALRDTPGAMVTTVHREQRLAAHPLVLHEATEDAEAWFESGRPDHSPGLLSVTT